MSSERMAISVDCLGKKYQLGATGSYGRLTETLSSIPRRLTGGRGNDPTEFWALKDITFEVPAGEIVGVIGANGAGKSTLLKILSRITRPTEGKAELRGRVGSLLEVGTGFHPELTGRENVYLSGAVLGMQREEIEARFDEIVDFSGIGAFLDTPVKRYSSGMQVRLGFAVAAHLDTEILLIDEVLAVGDAAFQRKSLARMRAVSSEGRTILFVSHNTPAVSRLCDTSLLLIDGKLALYEDTDIVIDRYLQSATHSASWTQAQEREGSKDFRFTHASLLNDAGDPIGTTSARQALIVEIAYDVLKDIEGLIVGLIATDDQGIIAFDSYDIDAISMPDNKEKGRYVARCHIPAGLLNAGKLSLSLNAFVQNARRISYVADALALDVWEPAVGGQEISMLRRGVVAPRFDWVVESESL
jgi:lipopolysaccharide transport system ATP-binding protein